MLNWNNFSQSPAEDKSDSLSSIIYENYDDEGELFDYQYTDTDWHPQSPLEDQKRVGEKDWRFSTNSIENQNSHFTVRNKNRPKYHQNHQNHARHVEDKSRKNPSLYRDILQSKLRGQPTSTFKGDWVRPFQHRNKPRTRKTPYTGSRASYIKNWLMF